MVVWCISYENSGKKKPRKLRVMTEACRELLPQMYIENRHFSQQSDERFKIMMSGSLNFIFQIIKSTE